MFSCEVQQQVTIIYPQKYQLVAAAQPVGYEDPRLF